MTAPNRARRGFSMIEVAVASALTAGLLMAALTAAGRVGTGNRVIDERARGHALAHELLAEIQATLFESPAEPAGSFGVEVGDAVSGDRLLFGDVDDFHNWSAKPPKARDGTPMAELPNWQRTVTVERVDASGNTVAHDTGIKRINVRVYRDTQQVGIATAYRTRGWDAVGPARDTYRRPGGDAFTLETNP